MAPACPWRACATTWATATCHWPLAKTSRAAGFASRPDHVLEELAEHLGATLVHHNAKFDPEPGAYSSAGHSHEH
ncbi:MAG: hypothetical protein MH208_13205 [Marinobacter sp.]|nr:hypothetical protein [Marinobacter sp.]